MEDKLNNDITKQLLDINKHLQHHKGHNRGQENILKLLENNGPSSQKQLQNELEVKPGSISELVSKLEKQGFIVKTKSKEDGRSTILSISELGKKKLTEVKKRGDEDICARLDEDEKQTLLKLLSKINQNN